MKTVLILIGFLTVAQSLTLLDVISDEWQAYKFQYGKQYSNNVEDRFRMKIYLNNRLQVAQHNGKDNGFLLGINHLSDLLPQEITSTLNGYNPSAKSSNFGVNAGTFIPPANIQVPDSVDWRTKGAVTPVKDQKHCGSCWAFSATGSLEGQNFRKTGKLISLSEQNLVDCTNNEKYHNKGCDGGLMELAFDYIKDNKGVDTEPTYPYEGKDDTCRYNVTNRGAGDSGYMEIPSEDEDKLKIAVATAGPISVAIDASWASFQSYAKGVYYEEHCKNGPTELDHGVLVVGYGTEDGKDYWLVKNSWNTSWGEEGYIKMSRNRDNNCGIATAASYPVV